MERDWDLCKKILEVTEGYQAIPRPGFPSIEGYTDDQIGYHCYLLQDAGLLIANDMRLMNMSWSYYPVQLTSAGHDFLEAAKTPGVWQKTLEKVRDNAVPATLEVVKIILFEFVKDMVSGSGSASS